MSAPLYDARVDDALAFAAREFRARARKGTRVPYLSHLLAVTALVMENGGDAEAAIAAVLHDYLEDIPGASLAVIRERFGDEVAEMVLALSDATDATQKGPWRERKDAYIARLESASPRIRLVAACDKLHNARSIVRDQRSVGDRAFDRFTASKSETLWYYRAVLASLRRGWDAPVLDELELVVREMHAIAGVAWS